MLAGSGTMPPIPIPWEGCVGAGELRDDTAVSSVLGAIGVVGADNAVALFELDEPPVVVATTTTTMAVASSA
jgi:hypothetical protein